MGGVYISIPYATFCIEYDPDTLTVLRAPPIARWALWRKLPDVLTYYQRKGATVDALPHRSLA